MFNYFGINDYDFISFSANLVDIQYFYCTVIFVPLGIILNGIQISVFYKSKKFTTNNIGFLYCVLAFVAALALTWNFLVYKYLPIINLNIGLVNSFTCFTFQWISRVIQELPLYVQTFITLIGYLKVKYPHKFKFLNRKQNILFIIVGIFIILCLLNATSMFRYLSLKKTVIDSTLNLTKISKSCSASTTLSVISSFLTSFLRSIIPNVFLIILDILVIRILFISKKKVSKTLKKERNFAKVLLILDVIFFVFNAPYGGTEIAVTIYQYILVIPLSNPTASLANLLHGFSNSLAYSYFLISFFINLTFNKTFRKDLCELFGLKVEKSETIKTQKSRRNLNSILT